MKPEQLSKQLLLITPDLSDNSLGRTYCLWLLATELGYSCQVVSFEGDSIWEPLADTHFALNCKKLEASDDKQRATVFSNMTTNFDAIIAIKPLPKSLGIALRARKVRPFRLIVDVDDPDLEIRLSHGAWWRRIAWRIRYFSFWREACIGNTLGNPDGIFVSNPVLQQAYGGVLLPHVRPDTGPGSPHLSVHPSIAFVGTLRRHKGVEFLRAAVDQLAVEGFSLIVTDDPPVDSKPHEKWVGRTTLETGMDIVRRADIVVVPSESVPNANGQLPVKLIDAMMLGRAIIVTDVNPLPWAVGAAWQVVESGDVDSLALKLKALSNPSTRTAIGDEMRKRALAMFSIRENVGAFERTICDTDDTNNTSI